MYFEIYLNNNHTIQEMYNYLYFLRQLYKMISDMRKVKNNIIVVFIVLDKTPLSIKK
jgi:hypothetical protein